MEKCRADQNLAHQYKIKGFKTWSYQKLKVVPYEKGPSINYVVSKLAIFDPLPPLSRKKKLNKNRPNFV